MKFIIIAFITFSFIRAHGREDSLDAHIRKFTQLNVPELNALPWRLPMIVFSHVSPQAPQEKPVTCEISLQNSRGKLDFNYSCDTKKAIKSEAQSLALN